MALSRVPRRRTRDRDPVRRVPGEHVRLGYAATEHGHQGDTVDVAYEVVTRDTTHRGLYVGATRGRDPNRFLVASDAPDAAAARDVLTHVLTSDRADVPAVAHRRKLASDVPAVAAPTGGDPRLVRTSRRAPRRRRDKLSSFSPTAQHAVAKPPSISRRSNPTWPPPVPHGSPTPPRSTTWKSSSVRTCIPRGGQQDRDAREAGVGLRRLTRHRHAEAGRAVDHAEAKIRTMQAVGGPAKHRLDEVALRAAGPTRRR